MRPWTTIGETAARQALQLAERVVNRLLATDPESLELLGSLAGDVYAVELVGTGITVWIAPEGQGVRLLSQSARPAAVRLRGTPLALVRFARASRAGELPPSGEVEILGDLASGQRVQRLLARLELDWEELLARYLGDAPAHAAARALRAAARWAGDTRRSLELDAGEYLRHEVGVMAARGEIEAYVADVDRLRSDVDRLEARINRLAR